MAITGVHCANRSLFFRIRGNSPWSSSPSMIRNVAGCQPVFPDESFDMLTNLSEVKHETLWKSIGDTVERKSSCPQS